jgi:biopolymer transport protein ExbD
MQAGWQVRQPTRRYPALFYPRRWLLLVIQFSVLCGGMWGMHWILTAQRYSFTRATSREEAGIRVPHARLAWFGHGEEDAPLRISITRTGVVYCGGHARRLADLPEVLQQAFRVYSLKARSRGRSPSHDFGGGAMYARLGVLLRADRDTPWRHVHEVMLAVGAESFFKISLPRTGSRSAGTGGPARRSSATCPQSRPRIRRCSRSGSCP